MVFPLFASAGRGMFRLLAQALTQGAMLRELDSPEVNRLRLDVPPGAPVLLVGGEEVIGAKQNRIVNATLVAPPGLVTVVPVSCIEQRRWTSGGEANSFTASQQVAYTGLRRTMSTLVNQARRSGGDDATSQPRVWREVAETATTRGVRTKTGAMTDIFDGRRDEIETVCAALPLVAGQIGAVAYVNGALASLDLLNRAEAWATLHPRVMRGHALEAIGCSTNPPRLPPEEAPAQLVAQLRRIVPDASAAATGMGIDLAFEQHALSGRGVVLDHELVHLSVFGAA